MHERERCGQTGLLQIRLFLMQKKFAYVAPTTLICRDATNGKIDGTDRLDHDFYPNAQFKQAWNKPAAFTLGKRSHSGPRHNRVTTFKIIDNY